MLICKEHWFLAIAKVYFLKAIIRFINLSKNPVFLYSENYPCDR